MSKEPPHGTIIKVWVVTPVEHPDRRPSESVLGVFVGRLMAQDYVDNELNGVDKYEVTRRSAFKWDDGDRMSLLDPYRDAIYELATDYTSEPIRRERELRASAAAKLTDEERRVLRL